MMQVYETQVYTWDPRLHRLAWVSLWDFMSDESFRHSCGDWKFRHVPINTPEGVPINTPEGEAKQWQT
jgi:hypothetical protein